MRKAIAALAVARRGGPLLLMDARRSDKVTGGEWTAAAETGKFLKKCAFM